MRPGIGEGERYGVTLFSRREIAEKTYAIDAFDGSPGGDYGVLSLEAGFEREMSFYGLEYSRGFGHFSDTDFAASECVDLRRDEMGSVSPGRG